MAVTKRKPKATRAAKPRKTTAKKPVPKLVLPFASEAGPSKAEQIALLCRSQHGDLSAYLGVGQIAVRQDPEFFGHLVAWDRVNGQVNDAHVALPIVALSDPATHATTELRENALAHVALLDPRRLLRAVSFGKEVPAHGIMDLRRLVTRYVRAREAKRHWWERATFQHRTAMKSLYARFHVKPADYAAKILFEREYPAGSVFELARTMKALSGHDVAGLIGKRRPGFLPLRGALGKRMEEPDILMAVIDIMTPTEIVTNSRALEELGVLKHGATRAAYEEAIERASKSKKTTLKTTRAAEAIEGKEKTGGVISEKLRGLQQRQLRQLAVEGDWLVLADKSGSMNQAIESARHVAASLAACVTGKIQLIFFDTSPRPILKPWRNYEEVLAESRLVTANGGTSIGCGLAWALDRKLAVNGIAIVSDGHENETPTFALTYKRYVQAMGVEPTVYFYQVNGKYATALVQSCENAGIELTTIPLDNVDYYSIPNLVKTMRTSRYSLVDEIMATPLLTLADVFRTEQQKEAA